MNFPMKFPEEFEQAVIDLEVDLDGNGGIQRFKTVADLQAWLNSEEQFWNWIAQPPASNHTSNLGDAIPRFNKLRSDCRAQLNNPGKQRWQQLRPRISEAEATLEERAKTEEELDSARQSLEQVTEELRTALDQMRDSLASIMKREIVQARNYLPSTHPAAQFLSELSEAEPDEAIYALDQILHDEKGASDQRQVEHTGRMMAALYRKNLNKKVRADQKAFKKAIETWSNELADFKARYEALEQQFGEISDRHSTAESAWNERADKLAESFTELQTQKEQDLENLKETYETHMQLKGPMKYWKEKRDEHAKGKKVMSWCLGLSALAGGGVIFWAGAHLLPEALPKDTIPWRNLGLFAITTTFILWMVRLFMKLMLSHIHLHADAREREVMISTFMALVRREDSREGIEKSDIALVLAPIFKPSTTGVIKDDGGPVTLGDFIGRLAGK